MIDYEPPRAISFIGPDYVIKRFFSPVNCANESRWYFEVPWACPEILAYTETDIVTRRMPTAHEYPDWKDPSGLRILLEKLFAEGIHHRDVHLGNVVRGPEGPLLIDWEYALRKKSEMSYDMYGPEGSDVPAPEEQNPRFYHWWNRMDSTVSVSRKWETEA